MRPSIVGAAYKEPIIGWVENMNAGTGEFKMFHLNFPISNHSLIENIFLGIILSIGKGLLRTMMLGYHCVADIIPVDLSINLIICTAWKLGQLQ